MRATDELGRRGEDLAVVHLQSQGLVVLERNYRSRRGEVDIIARDGCTLVICEVKTRSTDHFGHPLAAVDHRKLRRMRQVALDWMSERGVRPSAIRFDVIGILHATTAEPVMEHLRGVD